MDVSSPASHTMPGEEENGLNEMEGVEQGDANEEGEGDGIRDDSSEEPEEDEEEERRIRDGFIVDEEEEEEDPADDDERRRRRKKRKHRHRRREEEEEDLDEDDLDLLEENTGGRIGRSRRLTRLRRRESDSSLEASSSRRKAVVESSDDDLDENNIIGAREHRDVGDLWNDDRGVVAQDEDEDMDDFIDDEDDEEEGAGAMAEEEREERRRERRRLEKERRKALRARPELTGIDANAWDEIQEVFGDGHDYDWALAADEEDIGMTEEVVKPDMRYQDVFEPSEIKARLLTEDDDLIRAQDIPERMQLAGSTLSDNPTIALPDLLSEDQCMEAAEWVTHHLSKEKERDFFRPDGQHHHLLEHLIKAVKKALEYLLVQTLEVPYIYTHRRDYISHYNPAEPQKPRVELLTQNDLWRVYSLGLKFRSLCQRQIALNATYKRLGANDEYFGKHLQDRLKSVETVADVTYWLGLKYKSPQKDKFQLEFHDDDTVKAKRKLPSRISAYEVARKSIASKLADGYGIKIHLVVLNYLNRHNIHLVEDVELPPSQYAEQFVDPDPTRAIPSEELLRQARMILATELGIDPILRDEMRKLFKTNALISVEPTEKGKAKIDDHHPFYNFKYLLNKPITMMLQDSQFLNILSAESEHLVTVTLFLHSGVKQEFQNMLVEAFSSESFSDTAKAWNEERSRVVQEAIEKHLIPIGIKWAREYIREEVEDFLASRCADSFFDKINTAPYTNPDVNVRQVEPPSVLAISWGKGDPKKDEISLVLLDEAGRLREHDQLENLSDDTSRNLFLDLIKRRRPDLIVVGGNTIQTAKLSQQIKSILKGQNEESSANWGDISRNDQAMDIPVMYIQDEVARIYQHSKRAGDEFSALPLIAKYCVGLARYAQSPLNEYAALGSDLTAITFDDEAQQLVPKEKLLSALERTLVDVVNDVGVDINRAVNEPYYAYLLPYVAGLGPRKAQALIKKIASLGGNLVNREQFIKGGVLTTKIFLNCAGFLRIAQDPDYKISKSRADGDYSNSPDPLDDTRVHPEDYELARKMATDALELDEEDVAHEHPSNVVSTIMKDEDNEKKLDDLNLDEFAISMYEDNEDLKRYTLNLIRSELIHPFKEHRQPFVGLDSINVLTMLTGETRRTLRHGLIVSVLVMRTNHDYAIVRLDSGLEGVINAKYLSEDGGAANTVVQKGQTIPGVIIDVKADNINDQFSVELSARPSDVAQGDAQLRRVKTDEAWDSVQAMKDVEMQQRKKRAEVNRTRRVIKHPNFQNLNSTQAESYLENQHIGDVVIRPSSKGPNHLAVTWKVADQLYQHIDVLELNADPTGQNVGGTLIIQTPTDKHEFADLDELIVNYVQAMARRVEELTAHEKFKREDDELNSFLTNFVAANPSKSIYGFSLNRKRPGHFNLSFLAKKGSPIHTWPVRVAPEAYYLYDAAAPGVTELCDAFKVRYLHDSQAFGGAAGGGKTPYGAGRMTPGRTPSHRTPGHVTPGHLSVRQPSRTPNPYFGPPGGVAPGGASSYGGSTQPWSQQGGTTPAPWGGHKTPLPPNNGAPPGSAPYGMNPGRAAMIQNASTSNEWDSNGRW